MLAIDNQGDPLIDLSPDDGETHDPTVWEEEQPWIGEEEESGADPYNSEHDDVQCPDPDSESESVHTVYLVQAEAEGEDTNALVTHGQVAPYRQVVGRLTEKGVAKKFYLAVTLEDQLTHDALVDTAADITLMSPRVFYNLKEVALRAGSALKAKPCNLNVQAYSTQGTMMSGVVLIKIAIGPLVLVHPVYVSTLDTIPFLLGKDLLNRFEPLIDFQRLTIYTQVREPLPLAVPAGKEVGCRSLSAPPTPPNR